MCVSFPAFLSFFLLDCVGSCWHSFLTSIYRSFCQVRCSSPILNTHQQQRRRRRQREELHSLDSAQNAGGLQELFCLNSFYMLVSHSFSAYMSSAALSLSLIICVWVTGQETGKIHVPSLLKLFLRCRKICLPSPLTLFFSFLPSFPPSAIRPH